MPLNAFCEIFTLAVRSSLATCLSRNALPSDDFLGPAQVAERAGVHLDFGCNTGSCGICEVLDALFSLKKTRQAAQQVLLVAQF